MRASQHISLDRLPPVLILTLKRFEYNDYGQARKLVNHVHFPPSLTIERKLLNAVGDFQVTLITLSTLITLITLFLSL